MKHITQITEQGLIWVNVTRQTEKELAEVEKRFSLAKEDIKEALPVFQRPKIIRRSGYYFMVLHFPVFDRETRRLGFTEVDFFISPSFLITVHDNKLPALASFFNYCQKEQKAKQYFTGTMVHLLFELLDRLFEAIFPILLHVNEDINLVDNKLFGKVPGKEMAEEILRLKTNIVTFRRTMQGHRTVMERLILYSGRELNLGSYQNYINSLREYTAEIWQMLESQKESINALHETNESLLTLRTNEVMKTLTVISVITFPLTLLATLFGIQAKGNPLLDSPFGFWIIWTVIMAGAVAMALMFRRKEWK